MCWDVKLDVRVTVEGFMNGLALVNGGTIQVGGEQPEFPSRGNSVKKRTEEGRKLVCICLPDQSRGSVMQQREGKL